MYNRCELFKTSIQSGFFQVDNVYVFICGKSVKIIQYRTWAWLPASNQRFIKH